VIFLLLKVIPEISKLYGSSKLPEITVFVLDISKNVQNNIGLILAVAFALPIGFTFLYRIPSFRDFWDPLVLKIPLFGTLAVRSSVSRFSRTLATLVSSGVPLLTSKVYQTSFIGGERREKHCRWTFSFGPFSSYGDPYDWNRRNDGPLG
jgi:type II secretory pathway component PulF